MASSGAAALKAAAVIAVVVVLLMSSSTHGHQKTGPLCSNCTSLCNSNCSTIVAAECSTYCNLGPSSDCLNCKSQVLHGCQSCCSNSTSGFSCCSNGCVGDCATCGCDCTSIVSSRCEFPCRPYYPYNWVACSNCNSMAGQYCFTSCNATCYENCVKKDKGC